MRKRDNTMAFGLKNCKDTVPLTEIGNTKNTANLLGWRRSFVNMCKKKAFENEI